MYRMILFAHDGTEFAEAAKPHLIGLATATGAEVVLMRAVDTPVTATTGAVPGGEAGEPVAAVVYNDRVEQLRTELIDAGVAQVRTTHVEGAPAAAIDTRALVGGITPGSMPPHAGWCSPSARSATTI